MPSSDGFMLVDTRAEQQREDEYEAAIEKAANSGGPWPMAPERSPEEKAFAATIASSEKVYRNFTEPSGMGGLMFTPPRPRPEPNDSNPKSFDEEMPSRSSFEAGENASPFSLNGGK